MSETRGPTAASTTGSAFSGMQTTDFWTPADLSVDQILWDLSQNGTYELRIDGVLINTRTITAADGIDMLSGASVPITIDRGVHEIKLTKTAGSNGWRFRSGDGWVDSWFHTNYWHEAGGGEIVPFRIVATPETGLLIDGASPTWTNSGVSRTAVTFDVTFDTAVSVEGVSLGGTPGTYEIQVDGVVEGTAPDNCGGAPPTDGSAGVGLWIPFSTPWEPTPTTTYEIKIRRTSGAGFTGVPHLALTSSSNTYFDQGEWQESTGTTPAVRFKFFIAATNQTVDLPVIDGGEILAPEVYVDHLIELPVIEGGEIFGPDLLSGQIVLLPLIDPSEIFGPAVTVQSEQTKGPTSIGSVGGSFAAQTTDFWTPVGLSIEQILWDIQTTGTYELRIDGALVNTRAVTAGNDIDMLDGASTPLAMTVGVHELKIVNTGGSVDYKFAIGNGWVDDWFHINYFHEAGGNELVPLRFVATPDPGLIVDGPSTWSNDSTDAAAVTYDVTFNAALSVEGVSLGASVQDAYEILVDGVVKGTTPDDISDQADGSGAPGRGIWIPFTTPWYPTISSPHTIKIQRVGGGDFNAVPHIIDVTYTNDYFTQEEWIERPTLTPAVRYKFTFPPPLTLALPLIDAAQIFGPEVSAAQDVGLPLIDGGQLFGPSVIRDQVLSVGLIDGGWVFGLDVTREDQIGFEVTSWSRAGSLLATLDESHSRSWQDRLNDAGSFSLTVQNDDADYAHTGFDRIIRFSLDGKTRWAGLVERREVVTYSPGEEADETTTLSGPGTLALMAEAVVYPSRGVESLPDEIVRSFSWMSPDYWDNDWPYAKKIARQSEWTPWWAGSVPRVWPDPDAFFIWGDVDEASWNWAPAGRCLFRRELVLLEDMTVRIFMAFDNGGQFYIDGAEVADFIGFIEGQYVEINLTAGQHVFAARASNADYPVSNPAGFIAAGYKVDASGLLTEQVFRTDENWRSLPYPDSEPGFTPGQVIQRLIIDAQAQGELSGIQMDFTTTLDSGGDPWPEYAEISVNVGRDLMSVLLEMSESLIDVAMAPGKHVLRAWKFGGRQRDRAVTLQQTSDIDTSDFLELQHTGTRSMVNAMLVRYAKGTTEVLDTGSIATYGRRGGYLELGAIRSEAEARRIARKVMARRAQNKYATSGSVHEDASGVPYEDYDIGDVITAPDETGAGADARVISFNAQEDENGVITWQADLRDLVEEAEIRHNVWLKRMDNGALAGGTQIASPAGTPAPTAQTIAAQDTAEFSFDGVLSVGSLSPVRPASVSGNAVSLLASLTTAGTTQSTIVIYKNGATPEEFGSEWASVQIAAGETEGFITLTAPLYPVYARVDRFQAYVAEAGDGAEGLDVQIRTI